MSDGKMYGGLVTAIALCVLAIWLLITFWEFFLAVGVAALVLCLGRRWLLWWQMSGRYQYRTGRAIQRTDAAYQRARERMERIAQTYGGWR